MAFYQDDEDEQDPNNQAPGGVQASAESGIITGQGVGVSSPQGRAPNAPDKPGNFVGIKQYLDANKMQSAKLGDQAAGIINTSADQARQGVSALNQEAQEKIKPVNALSADLSGKLSSGAEALSGDERNLIKNTASAQYKGPQDEMGLGDFYTNASKATQKATSNIDNSGTEQGRMNLISQINNKPRTQGMNVFDNTLLQAGTGRQKLAEASQQNQDVKGGLDSASQAIRNQIGRADDLTTPDIDEGSGAIGQTNKAQSGAYKQIQDALGSWQSGFQPKVAEAQQALVNQQNRVTSDLGDNPYKQDRDTMELFGLQPGRTIYDLDLNKYLNQVSPSDINAGNVASEQDYARYAALADLAGEQNLMLKPEDIAKAGTAPKLSVDKKGLQQDLRSAEQNYEKAYTTSKGGVLNNAYLPSGYRFRPEEMNSATPKEIEEYWIPFAETTFDSQTVNAIKKSLEDWKKSQHLNNVVNPNEYNKNVPTFNTNPGVKYLT